MIPAGQVPAAQSAKTGAGGDALAIGVVALALVILHLACIAQYGYFREEFYYLACARHLGWGYVDHSPLSIFMLWLVTMLLGDSITAIRVLPVLASGGLVFMTGWFARGMDALLRASAPRRTEEAYAALIGVGVLVTAPLALPRLPWQALFANLNALPLPTRVTAERHETGWMPQLFGDRFG
jgi:hypothetical protein